MTITVLLADDQEILRRGFRTVLELAGDFTIVAEAGTGRQATMLALQTRPDVILMDVRMPDGDGIQATKDILAALRETRIMILTTYDLDEYAFAGLRAGASGFLLKDVQPSHLIDSIRAIAEGDAAMSPRVARRMLDLFGHKLPDESDPDTDPLAALTRREREVLILLAQGLSNAEIAARLYLSTATIKTHVGNVLRKLGLRDRVHATIFAYELGVLEAKPAGAEQ